MIQTGFETRVKIQQIIDNQLPEFILDESPKAAEFLKQYYISQEYQSGPVDIIENLDQYIKLDNLTPEVIVGSTTLSNTISENDAIIFVNSTKGFPSKYGLFQIDDEIITYTGISTNSFIGCIRGFSGITNYHNGLDSEELIFSTSSALSHTSNSTVKNLSSLFLQEFYKKIKYSLTPGLENVDFVSDLNVSNFIREARSLYQSKGTSESFRILFNVLYGETPSVIDLEQFLIKPSDSEYLKREIVVIERISGNPVLLEGQTIYKLNDVSTSASVSEVETITRKQNTYYKLLLFLGYDESYPTITGTFNITGNSKVSENVIITSDQSELKVISVDSTVGFPNSGSIFWNNVEIVYTDKTINQFLNCYLKQETSISIEKTDIVRSNEIYYGYEEGDLSRKVEFRITGVLSDIVLNENNFNFEENDELYPLNIGQVIANPETNKTRKEILANTWIYNTSTRYQVESFFGNTITLKSSIDKSSIKIGDIIEILSKNTEIVQTGYENVQITNIINNQLTTNINISLSPLGIYDIRRKLKKANSTIVPIEFGNDVIISDVLNVYDENSEYLYVTSNSLPSYDISSNIFKYNASSIDTSNYNVDTEQYFILKFINKISFITGDRIYYSYSELPIEGLEEGQYYVEVLGDKKSIKLYNSLSSVGVENSSVLFGKYPGVLPSGTHTFTLYSHKSNTISPQKILKKFKIDPKIDENKEYSTIPGPIGMLKNGVEIYNYKTNDKIYYGPIKNVTVLNGGSGYDVINPPFIKPAFGNALLQPVIVGSIEKIYVDPQEFDIDVVVSVNLSGGNGSGASFEPVIEKYRREIEFDARPILDGGGLDYSEELILFTTPHNLINGQKLIYDSNNYSEIGIGTYKQSNNDQSQTLKTGSEYYAKIVNDKTIQLYKSFSDYSSGINTVGFTTVGNVGIQKFKTEIKNTLTEIKIINGGSGYANRLLRVTPSGISTYYNTVNFENHGFSDGELVFYEYETSPIIGLSTINQYYINKLDSNTFRLCDAGVGGTYISNYERKKYVKFSEIGDGYQIFKYPDISLDIDYTSVGIGSTQIRGNIVATPMIRGKIEQVYVYDKGSDYGTTAINVHQRPQIVVKQGSSAEFFPLIKNGRIVDVKVKYGGVDYYSIPDLIIEGSGNGASLRPVVSNNKIVDVIVINSGANYKQSDTIIRTQPSGKNAVFQSNIRSLTINNLYKYGIEGSSYRNPASEVLLESNNNLQYAILGYSDYTKNNIGDNGSNGGEHSPIIGWAYDGNPIYGPYGKSNPSDSDSSIKKLVPGYKLDINNVENRPIEFIPGFFIEDYKFDNSGDLDEYNGRFSITPEFPNGVYAYFATIDKNVDNQTIGIFPYFIGNKYRSPILNENLNLDQYFNFNESNLIRNTLPYKVNDKYADYDFSVESNEIISQKTLIESVSSGYVSDLEIVNSGSDYSIEDELIFDNSETNGSGISAKVSEIEGRDIVNVETSVLDYQNSLLLWENKDQIKVIIKPHHNFSDNDYVTISGLSTEFTIINGQYKIGVTTSFSHLEKNIDDYSTTGRITDIYLSHIPNNISIGSSIRIENEIFSILNEYKNFGVIKVSRSSSGVAHTQSSPVYFLPDSFLIDKKINYFNSKKNDKIYFNPTLSIGIGTTPGNGITTSYNIGITTYNTFIPTQSIFIPNHPFYSGEQVILRKMSGSSIIASNTPDGPTFQILNGTSESLYVIKKSKDYIGIVTNVGLTTQSNGVYFLSSGSNNYEYSIEPTNNQLIADVVRINSIVSVSTSHNLKYGDQISLNVNPNLSVGIGTSSDINVKFDEKTQNIIINSIYFDSSSINIDSNSILIPSHKLKTGDKVIYNSSGTIASGLTTGFYYVYEIDSNNLSLCETYNDLLNNPPNIVDIQGVGLSTHTIGLVNPQIKVIKNNNLVFNLSDSSLEGYNFKIYYDQNFTKEFISDQISTSFSISGVGTIGISSTASLNLNFSEKIPNKLYYCLEKDGNTISPDIEVQNYSQIVFENSLYNGTYNINGIGTTNFTFSLEKIPEKLSYNQNECDTLEYSTTSTSEIGGIYKINLISGGLGYKKLPKFEGVNTKEGSGTYILPISNNIGNIKKARIVNEGFEYSSDKTLRPTAFIPKSIGITSSNTIESISILDGGNNYTSSPNLICIDSDTGEIINSGLIKANIFGSSIRSLDIEIAPKGLPPKPVTIKAINNSNGISVTKVEYSSSGIVTCTLTTPISGFTTSPFSPNQQIFVEGIQSFDGDGFNSSDYGYQFFTILNYINDNPAKLLFDISKFSSNPGIAKTIQEGYANIIKSSNYPEFEVMQTFSPFFIGEKLLSYDKNQQKYVEIDLKITESNKNFIRVLGTHNLSYGEKIKGINSANEATVVFQNSTTGQYNIDYSCTKDIGWKKNTGKLNEDSQVISDNDYYQNLSYTVKSSKTWNEIVTPVNSILHTSGLKNFADTQIENSVSSGIGTTEPTITLINNYISENRIDTINNIDLVVDIDTFSDKSKFLKFKNIKLADFILCKTNRVLEIDDISSQFSNNDDEDSLNDNILQINSSNGYNKFLVQVRNIENNKVQLSEIVTINDDENIYTLEKGSLITDDNPLSDIFGYVDDVSRFYLRIEPVDPYDSSFDIKILQNTFIGQSGIGSTQSIGFVDLIDSNKIISSGITTSLIQLNSSKYSSFYSNIHLKNNDGSLINYVEIYVSHDGNNTYLSEYYFDNSPIQNYGFIGTFGASVSGGILSLTYTNTSTEQIRFRSKTVGFGTTALGGDFYRFKLPGQIDGNERSIVFNSQFTNVSSSSTTILSLDKNLFTSAKSIVKVSAGDTSALHQVLCTHDGNDCYSLQYPFLSIGSTSGIGTFGSEIDNDNFILKFYPDQSVSGNIEILSFNESFYTELDYINVPPKLTYGLVEESVAVKNYYGTNSTINDKLDFELEYGGNSIFSKIFDPSDSSVLEFSSGKFNISNHFFSTGEELVYTPNSTFIGIGTSPMGIGATSDYLGFTTTLLPNKLWAIKDSNDVFRVSTRKEYALLGIGVTFTSYGIGNAHEIEMLKKNEKSLITVNNVVQYPISYTSINHTLSGNGGGIDSEETIFSLSGISSISLTDILKIDNEYMKVTNVGVGTTNIGPIEFNGNIPLVEVVRGFLGSLVGIHSDSSIVRVYKGSYNISKNKIFFTEAPRGSLLDVIQPRPNALPRDRSTFNGRVFLRNDYTSNTVYDNISEQFTGIGQTFILTREGINTTGIGTSGGNGIVFINNIFQTPTTLNNKLNNYYIDEDLSSGISSITFTGVRQNSSIYILEYDVNQNQLPRGGIIVSLGSTSGLGYAPLVGASVTSVIGAGGSITAVGIGTTDIIGSGYRNPVSVAVTETGHVGTAATIQAIVGAGGTLSFNIIGGGTGYTNPTINVSSPSYENLPIIGVSRLGIGTTTDTGVGLLLNVEVGASSTTVGVGSTLFEVSSFKITRPGYGFRRGDVFTPVGLVTAKGLFSPINNFEITVLETFTDSFGAWQFGELDYIDSIQNYQDGVRRRFPLYYNSQLLSFQIDENDPDSQSIDFSYLLVIFINGVLQNPEESYNFEGGTSFTFTVAPKPEDKVDVFFYRGTRDEDSQQFIVKETVKIGDTLQVFSNNNYINNTITQDPRIIYDISTADKVETNLYSEQGIDIDNYKPVYWTKQKTDTIVNGEFISKSRLSLESQIYPTANIIKDITEQSTEIFVDDSTLFNYEQESLPEFDAFITSIGSTFKSEQIKNISIVEGFECSVIGIATTSGIGTSLAIRFTLGRDPFDFDDLNVGYPIYISNTNVGSGVTSINSNDGDVVSISTSFLDNIYYVHSIDTTLGIITCNIKSNTSMIGIGTTGSLEYPVGRLSWGKLSGFTRSNSPISIGISGYTSSVGITTMGYSSGLSTYPTIQRRGYGLLDTGALNIKFAI